MTAHVYRFKATPDLVRLQRKVGGAAITIGSASALYTDITADDSQLESLRDAMAWIYGMTLDSTDPATTPNAQAGAALGTVFDPRKIITRDHFTSAIITGTQVLSERAWALSTVGTGPNALIVPGETARPGILRLEAGTSAAARAVLYAGESGVGNHFKLNASQNPIYAGFKLRPHNSIAPADLERLVFGFGSEWLTDAELANGIYVRYAPQLVGGDTAWILNTANGGVRTPSSSLVAPVAETEILGEIQITYPGGVPTARLAINGVQVGSNITTNFPTGAVSLGVGIYSPGSILAEAMVDIDYIYCYQDPT